MRVSERTLFETTLFLNSSGNRLFLKDTLGNLLPSKEKECEMYNAPNKGLAKPRGMQEVTPMKGKFVIGLAAFALIVVLVAATLAVTPRMAQDNDENVVSG